MAKSKLDPPGAQGLGAVKQGRAADPDRRRKFELPGIQDLSKEQEAARALPREGQHLIVGGPGTGKSVLALIRSRRHQRERDDYLFLVFRNHYQVAKLAGEFYTGDPAIPPPDLPRERVFMFMKRGGRKDIETILPQDQSVLRRKEL